MRLLRALRIGPTQIQSGQRRWRRGDWQPPVTLVRMPELRAIRCEPSEMKERLGRPLVAGPVCTLSGDKLFLIDAISTDADFTSTVPIPDGFVEASLSLPAPRGKNFYIKLRDDPATVDTLVFPSANDQ